MNLTVTGYSGPYSGISTIPSGRLGDLVDSGRSGRNIRRGMPTKAICHGYAFNDEDRKLAVKKLLKRIFNEVPTSNSGVCSNEACDGECSC